MQPRPDALPLADLRQVLLQYETAMRPLLSPQDFALLQTQTAQFEAGPGRLLQQQLERYVAQQKGNSWLKAYSRQRFLSLRTPLTIIGNFTLQLNIHRWAKGRTLSENGAALAWAVGKLYEQLGEGTIPPPPGSNQAVLSEQMGQVLGCARIPRPGMDEYRAFPRQACGHFGVFYHNHYYLVRLFRQDGTLLAPEDVRASLEEILTHSPPWLSVNFHTGAFAGSEGCALLLHQLSADADNRANFEEVERSLFHLSLFDDGGAEKPFQQLLFTNTENIWPYKPWSFFLFSDGTLAVNNEHTAADGITNVHLYQYVEQFSAQAVWQMGRGGTGQQRELSFLLSPHQRSALQEIRREYEARVSHYRVEQWSKQGILWGRWKKLGVGRDALIQLGFLFASRAVYPTIRCIHESVSTAHYYQGRTSCLRPVTDALLEAATAFDRPATSPQQLLTCLQTASRAHSLGIRRAKENVCFVRHGAGLSLMQHQHGTQLGMSDGSNLLDSSAYRRFCTQEISTSTVGESAVVSQFAFAPQVVDGLGIGYLPQEEGLSLTIAWDQSALRNARAFAQALDVYYQRLQALLSQCQCEYGG